MVLVLAKHGCGMPLVGDEDAVEELASDAADEAFGDGVGPRRPHWCLADADVDGGEHGVEGGGELGVAVPDARTPSNPSAACTCRLTSHDTESDLFAVIWGSRGRRFESCRPDTVVPTRVVPTRRTGAVLDHRVLIAEIK
jgi:hypothetical protein